MEALAEPCEVSRDLFQSHRLVASSSVDRRGTVANVRLYSATGPCLPWRTPSPSLLLPPLPQPLPPRSRCRCSCAASRSTPIVPAAPGSQARRSKSSGNARVLAELRRWGTGGIRSGRGQRGKPGEPGQACEAGAGAASFASGSSGFPFSARLSSPAPPRGVGAPAGAPGDEPGLEVAGEYGPGAEGSASGEAAALARRPMLLLSPSGGEN